MRRRGFTLMGCQGSAVPPVPGGSKYGTAYEVDHKRPRASRSSSRRRSDMMMDVEYDAASSRFSRERKAEQKRESVRKSREAAEKAKSRAQQALWEREGEMRREQEALRAAEQARIFEADMEANRGVVWSQRLVPVLSLAGESKGIVRRADKISLPYSAKVSLEEQQASKNGQLFFELSTADGRRTHAAILDYSAAEGTVGAPPELLRCLGLSHLASPEAATAGFAALTAPVAVAYRRLEKGTFAMLQPLRHSFHDVGDVKALLEEHSNPNPSLALTLTLTLTKALLEGHSNPNPSPNPSPHPP
jgi:hypothetical protein